MVNEKDREDFILKQQKKMESQQMKESLYEPKGQQANAYEKMLKNNQESVMPTANSSYANSQSNTQNNQVNGMYARSASKPSSYQSTQSRVVMEESPKADPYKKVSAEPEQKTYVHTAKQEEHTNSYMHTATEEKKQFVHTSDDRQGQPMMARAEEGSPGKGRPLAYAEPEDYSKMNLKAGAGRLLEAQKEYDMMMKGMDQKPVSKQDAEMKEKFTNQLSVKPKVPINQGSTVVFSGGRGGQVSRTTAMTGMRVGKNEPESKIKARQSHESQADGMKSGFRMQNEEGSSPSTIRVADSSAVSGKNIRQHDETNKLIRTEVNSASGGTNAVATKGGSSQGSKPSIKMGDVSIHGNTVMAPSMQDRWKKTEPNRAGKHKPATLVNTEEYGVHIVGGKFANKASVENSYKFATPMVTTNFVNLFNNPEIAKKFGIVISTNAQTSQKEFSIVRGKAGDITKEQILFELKQSGCKDEDALPLADEIFHAINADETDYKSSLVQKDNSLFATLHQTGGKVNGNAKIEVKTDGKNFSIVKPVGIVACKAGLSVEKPMRKLSRAGNNYMMGMTEQGGAEAGKGISETRQVVRVAALVAPNLAGKANVFFQAELQQHLNGFVVVPMGKGKTQQFTVAEMKSLLADAGISQDALSRIQIGDDFSGWAKEMLKANEGIKAGSVNKLNDKQVTFMKTLSGARAATLLDRRTAINNIYKQYGVEITADYSHFAVQRVDAKIKEAIRKYGGENKVPLALMTALKEEKMIANNNVYKNAGSGKVARVVALIKGNVEKHGGDAGKGLSIATRMANIAPRLVSAGIKSVWITNVVARELAQKSVLLAAKGALTAAKAANATARLTGSKNLAKIGNKLNKASLKTRSASNKFLKANRSVNGKVRTFKRDFKDKLKRLNPIYRAKQKIKAKAAQWWSKKLSSKGVGGVLARATNKVFGGFAKVFRFGGKVKAILIKYILIIAGIFFILWFIGCAISGLVGAVSSMFNLNSQEYDTKQYLAQQLQSYYEDDIAYITSQVDGLQNPNYNADTNPYVDHIESVTITYEDYKDYDKYNAIASDMEVTDFMQSSNNGEILSMALVKFDHNLGSLKGHWYSSTPTPNKQLEKVSEYIKQLYHGSHYLVVTVDKRTVSSEYELPEGEEADEDAESYSYEVYTVNATYKTYYFDYLFDCNLENSPQRLANESATNGNLSVCDSWDSIYYTLRQAGFTHAGATGAMANMAYESGHCTFDPATSNSVGPEPTAGTGPTGKGPYGICQWTSMGNRKGTMVAWCTSMGYDSNSTSGQLQYMIHEVNDIADYSKTKKAMKESGYTPYEAANVFGENFEGYGGGQESLRGGMAEKMATAYDAYKDDWSGLWSLGEQIAALSMQYDGKIHYTQGPSNGYLGTREISNIENAVMIEGNAVARGTDCSGFVKCIYLAVDAPNASGMPTYTGAYPGYATALPLAQASPGDIAWREGHVEIVIGDGVTFGLHKCYGGASNDVAAHVKDASTGSLSNFTQVYRLWQ